MFCGILEYVRVVMTKKVKTSMSIDPDLLKWIDAEVEKKRFANRTHAIEYALQKLKEGKLD